MTPVRPLSLPIACLAVALLAATAPAAPIQWSTGSGGNGHYYDLVLVANPYTGTNNSWATAKANAFATVSNGMRGHLVTITSAAENAFVTSLVGTQFPGMTFPTNTGAWIGGKHPEGWLDGPENGQPFGYTNWGGVEPNNLGQAYLLIDTTGLGLGKWADDSGPGGADGLPDPTLDKVIGYFVEFETVPEPASVLVFVGGLIVGGGVIGRRLRRATAG